MVAYGTLSRQITADNIDTGYAAESVIKHEIGQRNIRTAVGMPATGGGSPQIVGCEVLELIRVSGQETGERGVNGIWMDVGVGGYWAGKHELIDFESAALAKNGTCVRAQMDGKGASRFSLVFFEAPFPQFEIDILPAHTGDLSTSGTG